MNQIENKEIAIFAGGCFWCTEAVFLELKGVQTVVPGYIGGENPNPTYKDICSGLTGHAEAVQITFNSQEISFFELLEVFFATHDPTTLNRQGNDIGTQYRSEIFCTNNSQQLQAQQYLDLLIQSTIFEKPVITKISMATAFFLAEDYHHNYYNQNKDQGYCSFVIAPKLAKLKKVFKEKLKDI